MNRTIIIAVSLALAALLAGCGQPTPNHPYINHGGPRPTTINAKKQATTTWHIGQFTIFTHLLPKVYNPQDPGWQSFGVGPSAIYYVPKATPNELVEKAGGQARVVANLSCTTQGYVSLLSGPYLFVQCPAPNGTPEGILADPKTGATWILWQGGGPPIGTTYAAKGWAYFFAIAYENGPVFAKGSINLETGARGPLPSIMSQGGWGPLFAPDGTLYVQKYENHSLALPADLYRVNGLTSTLVAHLPSAASGIDANGTIWVSKKGGSLTGNAKSMTIRVWNPTIKADKVLTQGPGYVIYLGPTPSLGANGPVRVTVAVPGGSRTITVGEANVGNNIALPDGRVIIPAPHGRWQVVTVSGG